MPLHNQIRLRRQRAQSIFELCAITPVLVLVSLLFVDLAAIIICASKNHAVANNAARAASLQSNRVAAEIAARKVIFTAGKPTFIKSMQLTKFAYGNTPAKLVRVENNVVIGLPCPLAGWSEVSITDAVVHAILASGQSIAN